ncbi:glycosyl hydrolase family 18 protein [Solihabitans fulvus]|uniref:glycosyl hydrolase family 18 protein n=1 Tax=Solihabitans fulvus TaxID=1892852 RepID=UPI001661CD5B|nr:glycosyl hydrolase family 18 protein [Solihabitans fulvus]
MSSTKRWAAAAIALFAALGVAAAPPAGAQQQPQQQQQDNRARDRVVSAYFADWDVYGRGYRVSDIPVDKINTIQYAFGVPTFDKATGAVGCGILDPWADYQQVYYGGAGSVDGIADNPNDPNQHLFGNFNQLRNLKAAHPGLKVEISLGGWSKSTWFASVAATADRRAAFVKSCVDTFILGNLPTGGWPAGAGGPGAAAGVFDGIDIDWEYPTKLGAGNVDYGPADRHNATLLFQEFRRQLDELGATTKAHYLLTAALPAATGSTADFELAAAVRSLDWANVMTYDYNVPSGQLSAPNTLFRPDWRDPKADDPTWNTTGTVAHYLRSGVPANKIVVGVPFYGNEYLRVPGADHGLYQKADNSGQDGNSLAWDAKPQPSYHDLVDVAKVVDKNGKGGNGFTRYWDWSAGEPWIFSAAQNHHLCGGTNPDGSCASPYQATTTTTITYDDPAAMAERTNLVRAAGLRGVMAWEISQDSDDHALTAKLATLLPPSGPPGPPRQPLPPVVSQVPTTDPVVFVTIDDGWTTPADGQRLLLDQQAKPTMFVLPDAVANNPGYFTTLEAAGAVAEDHTVSHRDLTTLPEAEQQKEICGARDRNATTFGETPSLLRPPYGSYNTDTQRAAAACGMHAIVNWDAVVADGKISYYNGSLKAGDIILLHFTANLATDVQVALDAAKAAGLHPAQLTSYLH